MMLNKFSQLVPEENVWIPVRRFRILTLGLKGLKGHCHRGVAMFKSKLRYHHY